MNKLNPLSMSVKLLCLGSVVTAPAQIAYASEDGVEKIQITGSRISREGDIAPSPVSAISGEELVNTGALNIGEALNKMPSLKPTYGMQNSGRYIGTSGLNLLDLRGMGTARTLVLVNGKRHVSSSGGTAAVDTNSIPTAWIERVDIITGGASAVYGADAVTGVVNFILKDNIEGFSASVTHGEAQHSDYSNDKLSLSYGQYFLDGDANFGISYEYATQDKLNALDNKFTNYAVRTLKNFDQDPTRPDDINNPDRKVYDNAGIFALNEAGAYKAGDTWYTFNEDGSTRPIALGDKVDGISCVDCEIINLRKYTAVQPTFDRHVVNLKTTYYLNDDAKVYFEGKYAKVESEDWGQPSYFYFSKGVNIARDNAYLDSSTAKVMDENGLDSITVNRFNGDIGRRFEINDRETTRFVLGIDGVIADDWDYEAFVNSGKTELKRANYNNLIKPNFRAATDAIVDANGDIVCRDEQARQNGCVAMDIMGYGRPSQASIDYVNTTSFGSTTIEQLNAGATFSNGGLYDLPAGPMGVAFGVEYRKEKSRQVEDDNAKSGDTFFNALGEDAGEFDVSEVFFETSMPLIGDLPLIDTLTLDVAARYADYSTTGDVTSWKLGVDWVVYDDLRFRSTLSEAIRAPNIGELFGAASETFYDIEDPCRAKYLDEVSGQAKLTRQKNCSSLGVPTGFDTPYDDASVQGTTSGNKDLKPEESTSYTIGAVYTPSYVDGLSLTVDYWNIELNESISSISAQQIIERCVDADNINNKYCALVSRSNDGRIVNIQNQVLNISKQTAAGVDFEVNYDISTTIGDFKTRLIATRLIENRVYPFQDELESFEEYAGVDDEPSWKGSIDVDYEYQDFFASWQTRYLKRSARYRGDELATNPNPSNFMEFASYVISDVKVGYHFDSGATVQLGIDNLFDKAPSRFTTGTGDEGASYDLLGRFAYLKLSYKF